MVYSNPLITDMLTEPIVAVVVILSVLAVAVGYKVMGSNDKETWSVSDLEEDEVRIVEFLRSSEDKIVKQKELSNEFDWSDAKVSRLTSDLIDKNVVNKERIDRQNYVELNEEKEETKDN